MRKLLTILMCLAMATAVVCAQDDEQGGARGGARGGGFGLHGAYSTGGDVEEATAGLGIHFVAPTGDGMAVEFSVTQFSDDELLLESITVLALTVRGEAPMGETTTVYLGGGVNYNVFDYDNDAFGLAPLYEVELDDSLGYHVCAGIEFEVNERTAFFIDYRHSIVAIEGDIIFVPTGDPSTIYSPIDDDYDYGLIRIGFSIVM